MPSMMRTWSLLLRVPPCQQRTSRMMAVPAGAHTNERRMRSGSSSSVGGFWRVRCVPGTKRVAPVRSLNSVIT